MAFYRNMADIIAASRRAGHHWFSPETKRFFRCRVHPRVYGGKYFVTSEQFNDGSPRLYTVREAKENGDIDTVGEFQQYRTSTQAHRAAAKMG